jgi:hypothetical protein
MTSKTCQHPLGSTQLGRDVLCGRYVDHYGGKCMQHVRIEVGGGRDLPRVLYSTHEGVMRHEEVPILR